MDDLKQASKRRLSFVATVKAVLWSFFGVRKKSDYEEDIAGVLAAVIFVVTLLSIVKFVLAP